MTERQLEKILQEETDEIKVQEAVKQYRAEHLKPAEDKQAICDALCAALRLTRSQQGLYKLLYVEQDSGNEIVQVCSSRVVRYEVDVTADSGVELIRDIVWSMI